jgi:CheY-like chemotaxis protein
VKGKRILLVDDETNVTTMLRLLFERTREYEIRVANCSIRAMAVAEQFRPHLILLDVDMPGMDGGQLAGCLMQSPRLRTVPIVFLTGSVTKEEVSQNGGIIGGMPFMAKPVNRFEVLSCVKRNLEAARLAHTEAEILFQSTHLS